MAGEFATVADVQALLAQLSITASSKPDTEQVQGFIDEIDAEMRGVLRESGYVTTVTDADALNVLKMYNAYGAAAISMDAARPGTGDGYWQRYQQGLKRIEHGQILGLEIQADAQGLPMSDGVTSSVTKVFEVDERQW